MTGTITVNTVLNGIRDVFITAQIAGDADLTNAILFDASAYLPEDTDNKIWRCSFALNGFSATLFFDASTDTQALALPSDHPHDFEFEWMGGLVNTSSTGKTGDILITTKGLTTGDTGTIILFMKKK